MPIYEYRCFAAQLSKCWLPSVRPHRRAKRAEPKPKRPYRGSLCKDAPTPAHRSPGCRRPGMAPTTAILSTPPFSSGSGSDAAVSRTAIPSWQEIAARSWLTRVNTRPSRCAQANPGPRRRQVTQGPEQAIRAEVPSVGGTTTLILTGTPTLIRRRPSHPHRRPARPKVFVST